MSPVGHDGGSDARRLGLLLVGCCALTVLTAAFPWSRVDAAWWFGDFQAPIAVHTTAGFTCLMTCVLTALLVLSEGRTAAAREAVRTGCLLLTSAAATVLLWRLWEGPGYLRGAPTVHSGWFVVAAVAVGAALVFSRLRLPPRRR